MKSRALVALAVASMMVSAAGLSSASLDDGFVQDTKTYLSRLEKLGFAGVVIVAEAGQPVIAQGYGMANRERGLHWTPRTVATTGSITKQFTAAGIVKLQEDGRLGMDDPVTKYFPNTPEDKGRVTLQQLLTHSSGIRDPEGIDDFDPVGRDEYVRTVLAGPLASIPGERNEYANANFSLLGAVIEIVTGKSYEDAISSGSAAARRSSRNARNERPPTTNTPTRPRSLEHFENDGSARSHLGSPPDTSVDGTHLAKRAIMLQGRRATAAFC